MYRDLKKAGKLIKHTFFPDNKRKWKILAAFFAILLISGCISNPVPRVDKVSIDKFPPFLAPDNTKIHPENINDTVPDVDILAINQDVKSLLDMKVLMVKGKQKRLDLLMKILIEKIDYNILNDSYGVKTAQETFDTRTGNCLSYSNLFIAMARYAGLTAKFQEIPILPSRTRDGEVIFITRHIGASVDIDLPAKHLVELEVTPEWTNYGFQTTSLRYFFAPSQQDPRSLNVNPYSLRPVPDHRAFAQFYNNMGSQYLAEGRMAGAFKYFVKAIKTDPGLSFAWSNLGVVYRRNKQFEAAEAAYLQGLAVTRGSRDTSMLTIMSNLANLYKINGNNEKAEYYNNQVKSFQKKNPYYQYAAAKEAYNDALYKKSVSYFNEAIRIKDDEHLFYYGLALSYIKIGDFEKAEKNIDRAIRHTWDNRKKKYYVNFRKKFFETVNNIQ